MVDYFYRIFISNFLLKAKKKKIKFQLKTPTYNKNLNMSRKYIKTRLNLEKKRDEKLKFIKKVKFNIIENFCR